MFCRGMLSSLHRRLWLTEYSLRMLVSPLVPCLISMETISRAWLRGVAFAFLTAKILLECVHRPARIAAALRYSNSSYIICKLSSTVRLIRLRSTALSYVGMNKLEVLITVSMRRPLLVSSPLNPAVLASLDHPVQLLQPQPALCVHRTAASMRSVTAWPQQMVSVLLRFLRHRFRLLHRRISMIRLYPIRAQPLKKHCILSSKLIFYPSSLANPVCRGY